MSDEQKIKVHVLAVDSAKMNSIQERVCKMRPVEMTCFFDMKDFFAVSKERKPDVVALSMNYPHSGVAQFPQFFESTVRCPVIVFLEEDNPKGRTVLSVCDTQYKISSMVTAHNLWMKIRHCLDAEAAAKEAANKKNNSFQNNNDDLKAIHLKGGEESLDNDAMMSSLGYLLKANQRGDDDKKIQGYNPNHHEDGKSSEFVFEPGSGQESGDESGHDSINNSKKGWDQDSNLASKKSWDQDSGSGAKNDSKQGWNQGSGQAPKSSDSSSYSENNFGKAKKSQSKNRNHGSQPTKSETERIEDEKREDILLKQSHKVIRDIISLTDEANSVEFACADSRSELDSHSIKMMTVKHNRAKGCLMLRARSDQKLPVNWFTQFRKELLRGLQDAGYKSEISPYLAEVSKEVSGVVESIDKFSDKPQSGEPKFLFADHDYEEPNLVVSEEAGYLEIDPKMIKPEKILYFDVFVYLPKNKKSVRYIKRGGALSITQAERLEQNSNGDKLYVDPKEELQLRQFLLEVNFEKRIRGEDEPEEIHDASSSDEVGSSDKDSTVNKKAS